MSLANNNQEYSVVEIILSESLDAREFSGQRFIHPVEYARAKGLINRQIDGLARAAAEHENGHHHEAITVLGTRGSGKTSFLLSLKKEFEQNKDLQVLKIIDPTLIEDKGHVFLTIISSVAEAVEAELAQQDVKPPRAGNQKMDWKAQMQNLAAGLPGIDGIGKDDADGWNDPEFVMDSGMRAVTSAKNLADNFDKFLKGSLDILRKKAFLLFFDDIDVNANKGIDVLESIRKYLVTFRMIIVVSGDLNLYLWAVRNKKWKNFGKPILEYEGKILEKMPVFNARVTQLAAQYLLKVLQPAYRIHLTTLLEKRNSQIYSITVQVGRSDIKADITSFYHQLFNNFGVFNKTQLEVYRTFMLGLPARTQIQFLFLNNNSHNGVASSSESISDVFIADLTEKDVDVGLINQTPKYYCSVVLKLLLAEHNLLDSYQLQPTSTDDSLNGSLMALWMLFGWYIRQKCMFLIFDYFIKIAYVRNLLAIVPYRSVTDNGERSRMPDIENLSEAGDIPNDGVLRDVISAIQSYLFGVLELKGPVVAVSPYFIRLYALKSITKSIQKDTIDYIFNNSSKAECILAFMPCYNSAYSSKNESRVMYSIYVLIGAIGELVKRYEIADPSIAEMQSTLKVLSQFRSYIVPDFRDSKGGSPQEGGSELDGSDELPESIPNEKDSTDKELAEFVVHWMEQKSRIVASTHLLGKMLTRFFYAMNNISTAYGQEKDMPLGELFHLQVTAFMNAILVEDATENGDITSLNINNTRLSDTIFIYNLSRVAKWPNEQLDKLSLSRWLISCPILHPYLRWDERDKRKIDLQNCMRVFCGKSRHPDSFRFNISRNLDEVGIIETKSAIVGSPELLKDPVQLVKYLRARRRSRVWFNYNKDKRIEREWNNKIIEYEPVVFGTGRPAIGNINKFRDFLLANKNIWKSRRR